MPTGAERERGPTILRTFLSLSVVLLLVDKLTLSDEAQVTLQLTVTLSDLVQRFVAGPPLFDWGGGGKEVPPPGFMEVLRITQRSVGGGGFWLPLRWNSPPCVTAVSVR